MDIYIGNIWYLLCIIFDAAFKELYGETIVGENVIIVIVMKSILSCSYIPRLVWFEQVSNLIVLLVKIGICPNVAVGE